MTRDIDIRVERIYRLDSDSALKGFADILIGESLIIKGIRIITGKNGLFLGMPRELGKDGKWYNRILVVNDELKEQLTGIVLSAFAE